MEQDNTLCVCCYCGAYEEYTEKALETFGVPECCSHKMTNLDRNLILTIGTIGLPKLVENLSKELTKDF